MLQPQQKQSCTIPQHKLRAFYRLTPAQQHTLLDIAAEMVTMNRERASMKPTPPHLYPIK